MTETELLDRFEYLCSELGGGKSRRIGGDLSIRGYYDFDILVLFDHEESSEEITLDGTDFVALAQWLTGESE